MTIAIPKHWPVQDRKAYRPIEWFLPYPRNPKTHPPAQVDFIGRMIEQHGPDQPIVVDEGRVILKGHGRRLGCLARGIKFFTFIQRFGLSDAEKIAMRIEDNQAPALGGWDLELVRGEVAVLKSVGYDLALLGFGEQQLVSFTTMPQPPGQFATFDENIAVQHQCPRCRYVWSGNSAPAPEPEPKKPAKKKK